MREAGSFTSQLTEQWQPGMMEDLRRRAAASEEVVRVTMSDAAQRQQAAQARNQEGIGSFIDGVVRGDFADNESWSRVAGQTVVGIIPGVGQVADARDTLAALRDVGEGREGAGVNLVAATVGWVPVFGDPAKAAIRALRAGKQLTKQVAEEAATGFVRQDVGQAIAEGATKGLSEAEVRAIREGDARLLSRELERIEAGHSLDRHGPEVSDAELERRLTEGVTPDGKVQNAPPASTRFNSHEDWLLTRQSALGQIRDVYRVDLTKPPAGGAPKEYNLAVEYDRAIDDGFVGANGKIRLTDASSGKNFNVYNSADPVDGITRTFTRVRWNDASNQWDVVQHFPLTEGWDNATKTYSNSATAHVGINLPPQD